MLFPDEVGKYLVARPLNISGPLPLFSEVEKERINRDRGVINTCHSTGGRGYKTTRRHSKRAAESKYSNRDKSLEDKKNQPCIALILFSLTTKGRSDTFSLEA